MSKSGRSVEEIYRLRRRSGSVSASASCINPAPAGYTDLAHLVTTNDSSSRRDSVYDTSTEDDDEDGLQSGYTSEPNTTTRSYRQADKELLTARHRRTGSLSDNDIMDLVHGEDEDEDESGDLRRRETSTSEPKPDCEGVTAHVAGVPDHVSAVPDHVSAVPDHVSEVPDHVSEVPDHVSEVPDHVSEVPDHVSEVPDHVA
ncbi:hypothetical protein FHG87_015917 [Trinorchestia longiramus]|nr:hypothetical protein FHG87_015917 [Trinorchestia longiramus]